jgi:hypothetical protein
MHIDRDQVEARMVGTIIATTQSGSAYVLTLEGAGVLWVRIPAGGRLRLASSGWLPIMPRVVRGERLLLGVLRTTPVDEVAFLPPAMDVRAGVSDQVAAAS